MLAFITRRKYWDFLPDEGGCIKIRENDRSCYLRAKQIARRSPGDVAADNAWHLSIGPKTESSDGTKRPTKVP
jgi:hypothetical protein